MAVAPIERSARTPSSLDSVGSACAALAECAREVRRHGLGLSRPEALQLIVEIERASRIVDHLQVLAARLAEEHYAEPEEPEPEPGLDPNEPSGSSAVGAASLLARAEQALRADTSAPSGPASSDPGTWGAASSAPACSGTGTSSPDPSGAAPGAGTGSGFRDCADFLRSILGISRAESRRRLTLAALVLPGVSPTGAVLPARLETLGAATQACVISGRAATLIGQALLRVHPVADPDQLESMEESLTRQAVESDEDILRVLTHRWEAILDQDGQEPTDKVLRARQGVFLKGRHHGLHVLEIGATDEQYEHLATIMNTTTNPRLLTNRTHGPGTGADFPAGAHAAGAESGLSPNAPVDAGAGSNSGDGEGSGSVEGSSSGLSRGASGGAGVFGGSDKATRAQLLLEGLVAACRVALTTTALPATGGHRPQVMVTIDYHDLLGSTHHPGHAVFTDHINAQTIRRLACDADIIPLVLGGAGQVLDIGRAQRLFPPHLRRALVARDKGCAFPDCTIPASWCEAHHINPWSTGGTTSITNGVLLCSHHHHLVHHSAWRIEPRAGIPWFHPPGDSRQTGRSGSPGWADGTGQADTARRNRYWQAGQIIHDQLQPSPGPRLTPSHSPDWKGT